MCQRLGVLGLQTTNLVAAFQRSRSLEKVWRAHIEIAVSDHKLTRCLVVSETTSTDLEMFHTQVSQILRLME
jgi:hypothetical protein